MCNQAVFRYACIIDRRQCTVLPMVVSVSINRGHSYMLAFMTQAKTLDMLGAYRSLRHHFMQCAWPDY